MVLIHFNGINDCDGLQWTSKHHCVQCQISLCGGLALHLVVELPDSLTVPLVLLQSRQGRIASSSVKVVICVRPGSCGR